MIIKILRIKLTEHLTYIANIKKFKHVVVEI